MLKITIFLYSFIIVPVWAQINVYIQSNSTTSYDGSSESAPLKDINDSVNIFQTNKSQTYIIILLPSTIAYHFGNISYIDQPLIFKGRDFHNQKTLLVFYGQVYFAYSVKVIFQEIRFEIDGSHHSQFTIRPGGTLQLINVLLIEDCSNLEYFILGDNCTIIFEKTNISNTNFTNMKSFIFLNQESFVLLNYSTFLNLNASKSTFLLITHQFSKCYLLNTIISNSSFNEEDIYSIYVSFLFIGNYVLFLNSSFENVILGAGHMIRLLDQKKEIMNFVIIKQCFFKNIVAKKQNLFFRIFYLTINVTLEELYIFNNSILEEGCVLFRLENDYSNIIFVNVIFKNNFARTFTSYYIFSVAFKRVYIKDSNIQPEREKLSSYPMTCIYIEDTAYYHFEELILEGGYSDGNVAGLMIHVNWPVQNQRNQLIQQILTSGFKFYVYFIKCFFTKLYSINKSWLDKGSSISFHSDIPIYPVIFDCYFVDNFADKGATALESWGQNTIHFNISNSVFINNTATSNTPCLAIYVMEIYIDNCIFVNNSMNTNADKIEDFEERTLGGIFYGENDLVLLSNNLIKGNKASYGGVLHLYIENKNLTKVIFINNIFQYNRASQGGILFIKLMLSSVNLNISGNLFIENEGFNGGCFYLMFTGETSQMTFQNNSFTENKAIKGGVYYLGVKGPPILFLNNVYFRNLANFYSFTDILAYGGVFFLSDEKATIVNGKQNLYKNNTSTQAGGVFAINRGVINEKEGLFSHNSATTQGGAIYVRNSGKMIISFCSFELEKANIWGGVVYLFEKSNILVENSTFKGCTAYSGGVFYFENHQNLTILSSLFEKNYANEAGIAQIDSSNREFTIINCGFYFNLEQKYLFYINAIVALSTFSKLIVGQNNCSLVSIVNSQVLFTEVEIYSPLLKDQISLFIILDSPQTIFDKVLIKDVQGMIKSGCGFFQSSNHISIIDSLFQNVPYGCLYFLFCDVYIKNSEFDNYETNLTDFPKNFLEYGNFITIQNSYKIVIEFTNFKNNILKIASIGGAIKTQNTVPVKGVLNISNSNFTNISAFGNGGAIYLEKQLFYIFICRFESNKANVGGAIYFRNSEIIDYSQKYIYNNTFINNFAEKDGGAIYFYDNLTNLLENFFKNNSAIYGNDIGSFPVYIRTKIYNLTTLEKSVLYKPEIDNLTDEYKIFDSFESNLQEFILQNYETGRSVSIVFVFELLDFYNKKINSINTGMGHIKYSKSFSSQRTILLNKESRLKNNKTYNFENDVVKIQGDVDTYNQNGSFLFPFLSIFATPLSFIELFITNDVMVEDFSLVSPNLSMHNIENNIGVLITVHLEECLPGELYISDINYCSICSTGKYSLNPSDMSCLECPNHATCFGGNKISVHEGFWQIQVKNKIEIYQCINYEGACIGGFNNVCERGYKGTLCSECDIIGSEVYTKIGRYCVVCLYENLNALFLVLLVVAFVIFVVIMVRSNSKVTIENFICYKTDNVKPLSGSVLFKIFVDHIQLIGLTENIGFSVPEYFRMSTDFFSNVVYIFEQLLSLECFIQNRSIINNSIIFLKVMTVSLLPIICTISIVVFWVLYSKFKRSKTLREHINSCISSIIITLFLIQPTILNTMLNIIGCIDIGENNYVMADMGLKCNSYDHLFIIYVFSIPSLILWIVAFPFWCVYSIFKQRSNIKDEQLVMKFGFLYNGYNSRMYYWWIVKFFQKVLIILVRVSSITPTIKMLTLFSVLMIGFMSENFKNAYVHRVLNNLENLSNAVALSTLFLSLYFVLGVDKNVEIFIYVLILMINLSFLVYWLKIFCFSTKVYVMKSFQRLSKLTKKKNFRDGQSQNWGFEVRCKGIRILIKII